MNKGRDPYDICTSNLLGFSLWRKLWSIFKIIFCVLENRLSNLQPKPKVSMSSGTGEKNKMWTGSKLQRGSDFDTEGTKNWFFQYRLKARHYARHFARIVLFQGEAGFFRAGNGPPGRLSNFLKSVACSQPCLPCFAEHVPTFPSRLSLNITSSKVSQREELGTPLLLL